MKFHKRIKKSTKIRFSRFILKNRRIFKHILLLDNLIPANKIENNSFFCIGLPRSGTHTLELILRKKFKLKGNHEPISSVVLNFIINEYDNATKNDVDLYLSLKDRLLNIEFEASHYMIHMIKDLVQKYPYSKYIMSIRNPHDWLVSMIYKSKEKNHKDNIWRKLQFKVIGFNEFIDQEDPNIENILALAYLDYYKKHLELCLKEIPKDRLMIIDTYEINDSLDLISKFIQRDYIENHSSLHSGKARKKFNTKFSDEVIFKLLDVCNYFINTTDIKYFKNYKSSISNKFDL